MIHMTSGEMLTTKVEINTSLVSKLIHAQFPQWADLPIKPVEFDGWDNRTFRLGENMSMRLPSAECYSRQVLKEHLWLPKLAPHLPIPIPVPLAMGNPTDGYPWHWSVYKWLEGDNAKIERIDNLSQFATTLANFLIALYQIDTTGGPPPGKHNFFRGGPLATYDTETRDTIAALHSKIDSKVVTAVWETALNSKWQGTPVWLHGNLSKDNLLIRKGRLCAVIDFGCSGIGDPACDLTIAWTLFSGKSREAFCAALPVDETAWERGRGWALWKALITLLEHIDINPLEAGRAQLVIDEVLADHRASA